MNSINKTTLYSPAKINLGLQVVGKLISGKHHLVSPIIPIGLQDIISITQNNSKKLSVNYIEGKILKNDILIENLNLGNDCLLTKTYHWFMDQITHFNPNFLSEEDKEILTNNISSLQSFGLAITLEKNIPSPAGLGGGSSNAASLLNYLLNQVSNNLCKEKFAKIKSKFIKMSSKIGADVPFFLSQQPALINGVYQIDVTLAPFYFEGFIAVPPFTLSTTKMFTALNKAIMSKEKIEALAQKQKEKNLMLLKQLSLKTLEKNDLIDIRHANRVILKNDFLIALQNIDENKFSILSSGIDKLANILGKRSKNIVFCGLSGSGSAIYCGSIKVSSTSENTLQPISLYEKDVQSNICVDFDTNILNGWQIIQIRLR